MSAWHCGWSFAVIVSASACGDSGGASPIDAENPTVDAEPACPPSLIQYTHVVINCCGIQLPLSDVEVCMPTHPEVPCQQTDANGEVTLCVPPDEDVAISYVKDGYMKLLFGTRLASVPTTDRHNRIQLHPYDVACPMWQDDFGVECPPTTAALLWNNTYQNEPEIETWPAGLSPQPSYTFTPVPDQGPFQGGQFAVWSPAPDSVVIELSHSTLTTCGPFDLGWAGPTASTVRVPMASGFRSFVASECH